jgi:hypothetical protein
MAASPGLRSVDGTTRSAGKVLDMRGEMSNELTAENAKSAEKTTGKTPPGSLRALCSKTILLVHFKHGVTDVGHAALPSRASQSPLLGRRSKGRDT